MTACKTRRQPFDCKSARTGAWYQRGAESVIGGVERGKRLAELRNAHFAEQLHGGVVAAHDGNACEAGEYMTSRLVQVRAFQKGAQAPVTD
jgi:hypothetical protein